MVFCPRLGLGVSSLQTGRKGPLKQHPQHCFFRQDDSQGQFSEKCLTSWPVLLAAISAHFAHFTRMPLLLTQLSQMWTFDLLPRILGPPLPEAGIAGPCLLVWQTGQSFALYAVYNTPLLTLWGLARSVAAIYHPLSSPLSAHDRRKGTH